MPAFGSWKPVHDTHAIFSASTVLSFAEPVGDVTWRRALSAISGEATAAGLEEHSPIGVQLPPELLNLGILSPAPAGMTFTRREEPESISERVQITRDMIRYDDFAYIRWAPYKQRSEHLISSTANAYLNVSSLSSFVSEYVDVFEGLSDSPDVREVISMDSGLVALAAVRPTEHWHSHTGWFEPVDGPFRRLINLNIDVLDRTTPDNITRQVRIRTKITDQFGEIAGLGPETTPLEWVLLDPQFTSAHERLKSLLGEVLTPQATVAISLQ